MMIRNSRGQFVKQDNPLAVIGALRARRDQELAAARLREQQGRRDAARMRGYSGPLTRAELAAMMTS